MKLDKNAVGPDEPIVITGDYTGGVRVYLDGQPLRIDQIQDGYIIVWTPEHREYAGGKPAALSIVDGKIEDTVDIELAEYVPPVVIESEPTSFVKFDVSEKGYQMDWKPQGVSMILIMENEYGEQKEVELLSKGTQEQYDFDTKAGLRVAAKGDEPDVKADTGVWRVVGMKSL